MLIADFAQTTASNIAEAPCTLMREKALHRTSSMNEYESQHVRANPRQVQGSFFATSSSITPSSSIT